MKEYIKSLLSEIALQEIDFAATAPNENLTIHKDENRFRAEFPKDRGKMMVHLEYVPELLVCDVSFGYIEGKGKMADFYKTFVDNKTIAHIGKLLNLIKEGYKHFLGIYPELMGIRYEATSDNRDSLYRKLVHRVDPSLESINASYKYSYFVKNKEEYIRNIKEIYDNASPYTRIFIETDASNIFRI